ncbi:MAG: response regulator [Actinomycetota bacterium]
MRTLLIADDESVVRSLVRMTLENEEYEILEAADGDEALARVRSILPDLVLLDVTMPGTNGFDVCRTLKADPATKGVVVVMLTALAEDSHRGKAEEAGADGYLVKPFSPLELMRTVDDALKPDGG